ncbi:MAG TPA: hypothetical protein PLV92_00910, partial [Pirellulaceae bacterium]|nr:hypothetical protein [Pirellulaceae bacterium]
MPLELQLARLRRRLTVWVCARGLERLAWLAPVLLASDYAIDRLLRLGLGVRIGLLLGLSIVAAVAATRWLLIPLWRRPTDAALCGEIERRVPEARGLLTAVYELSRPSPREVSGPKGPKGVSRASGTSRASNRETLGSPELIAELKRQVDDVCSRHDFADLVAPIADARRRLRFAAAALVWIVGFVAVHHTREGMIWLRRNVLWKSVAWPQRTYLEVAGLKDGKLRIARGSGTTVDVLVGAKSSEIPAAVQVDFRPAAARPAQAVRRAGDRRFQIGWRNVLDSFQFRVRGGDEVTEWLPVELVTPATVQQLEVTAEPPAYIGSEAIELTSGLTAQPIPHGSRLQVRGRASRPLKSATLVHGDRRSELTTGLKGEFRGSVEPTMLTSGRYQLELRDQDGFDIAPPVAFQLDVVADQPPVVRGRWVGASRLVTPRAQVRFHAGVEDDHGLARAEATVAQQLSDVGAASGTAAPSSPPTAAPPTAAALTTSTPAMSAGSSAQSKPAPSKPSAVSSDTQSAPIVVARREFDTATRSADWSELLDLEPLKIPIGSLVTLQVSALDRDDVAGPNRGEGAELLVRVVAEDELRRDLLRREKEQRQQLTQQLDDAETLGERLMALASSVPDADPAIDRVERLLEASSGVRAIAAALDSSTLVLQQVVDESVHNRIEPTNGPIASRLGQRVLPVLRRL